ncbi:MAG: WD40 repeat domain-containing protein [Planctomycetes bacterium]|nr:WD40 repeat domain-containing protein [Planctomycetota bacterium]
MRVRFLLAVSLLGPMLGVLPGCCCGIPGTKPAAKTPQQPVSPAPIVKGPGPTEKPPPPADKKPKPPDPKPKTDDELDGAKLEPDPLRQPLLPPTDPKASLLVPGGNGPVRHPRRPGPIAAVMSATKQKMLGWDVWNLQSMKRLGSVPSSTAGEVFLSPDGMYLAMPVVKPKGYKWTSVEVYTVADGKLLSTLKVKDGDNPAKQNWIADFAGPGQFLSLERHDAGGEAKVWDVKTGAPISTFKTAGDIVDRMWTEVSPGGRYLAIYHVEGPKSFVYVYEVATGKLVRTIHPKLPTITQCAALTFSYDGKELAALVLDDQSRSHVQAWDFETGKRTAEHTFTPALPATIKEQRSYGRALEWLPDRSGWLALGQLMIDRERGHVFWTVPKEDADIAWERRFVDANHYATIVGQSTKQLRLQIIALPRDEIAAARKK